MKIKKFNWALVILLLISFLVRIYKINNLSLFGDEIDVGYQAYSILQTGRDYKGNFLPTYIQSLSESRAPLLIYLSIPGIRIFGLTELGVRITPIIFGVLSIYLLYHLVYFLSKSHKLAILSATALSFCPWHFHYSRTAFEVTLLLSLTLLGVYLFEKFILNKKTILLIFSIISFGLTFYTYNTANIFTPLLVTFLLISNFSKLKERLNPKTISISIILTLLLIIPILTQIFSGQAANRFGLISIFNDPKTINNIIDRRTSFSAVNQSRERFFYNKATMWQQSFFQNYLQSLSPSFLFTTGDTNNVRHSLPHFGLLFLSFFPLFIIGLFKLKSNEKLNKLMLFWLFASPIASSLTINGGTHATRLFLMLPPLAFFVGQGVTHLISSSTKILKIILTFLSLIFIFEVSFYTHEYFNRYPKEYFKDWNYGYKQLFESIPISNANRIFISNTNYNSLLPFLFYQKISPDQVKINDLEQPSIYQNMNGFKISDNFYFINSWQFSSDIFERLKKTAQSGDVFLLFQLNEIPGDMDFSQKPPEGFNTIKTVYNPNHTILGQLIQKL